MCDLVTVFGRVFNRRNWMIPSAVQCDIRKIDTKHILFTHLDITFYVAIPINRDSTAPKPESAKFKKKYVKHSPWDWDATQHITSGTTRWPWTSWAIQ